MERNGLAHEYDPGALKVTISKFYRPDGASTQLEGVKADIVLPSMTDSPKFGESSMKNPLIYDTVPAAKHVRLDLVQPYLKILREKSEARMASDEGFTYLKQSIEEFRKKQAATDISLNEAERQAEKDKAKAEDDAWEKKLAERPKKATKEYEVTVKNAVLPGLPPPPEKVEPKAKLPLKDGSSDSKLDRANIIGDLLLAEAQNILVDYIALLNKTNLIAAEVK
jgi:carboxyl-terminal processing protease